MCNRGFKYKEIMINDNNGVFILSDELNAPTHYKNDVLPPQELVEQFLKYKSLGFYNRAELLEVNNLNFMNFQCVIKDKEIGLRGNYGVEFAEFNKWVNQNKKHLENMKNNNVNTIPRRIQLQKNTPAELAIRAAVGEVEIAGADTRLTEVTVKLGEALTMLADYVDEVIVNATSVHMFTHDDIPPMLMVDKYINHKGANFHYRSKIEKVLSMNYKLFKCVIKDIETGLVGDFGIEFDEFNQWVKGIKLSDFNEWTKVEKEDARDIFDK